ncbi:hypothetical protein AB6N30_03050 [Fusobacterium animalis]|jgi:hypothetical protein|uniref:hypothetical protein n=1 Tax=Fusobacterium TaxID=848 RepID=UPI002A7EC121|nr:hypothetical protein [Fusobacterium sp.]
MEKKTGTLEKLIIRCALAGVGFVIYEFGVFMHDNIFRRGYLNLLMLPIILIGVYLMAQPVIFILKPILGILSIFEVTYIDDYLEKRKILKEYQILLTEYRELLKKENIDEGYKRLLEERMNQCGKELLRYGVILQNLKM